jgi:hypothetical protein
MKRIDKTSTLKFTETDNYAIFFKRMREKNNDNNKSNRLKR